MRMDPALPYEPRPNEALTQLVREGVRFPRPSEGVRPGRADRFVLRPPRRLKSCATKYSPPTAALNAGRSGTVNVAFTGARVAPVAVSVVTLPVSVVDAVEP